MLKASPTFAALRQLRRANFQRKSFWLCAVQKRLVSVRLRASLDSLEPRSRFGETWLILDGLCLHALSSFQRTDAVPSQAVLEGNLFTLLPAALAVNPRPQNGQKNCSGSAGATVRRPAAGIAGPDLSL